MKEEEEEGFFVDHIAVRKKKNLIELERQIYRWKPYRGRKTATMSTGKRLAKRSIIGTRVCAPGEDGKYYSGVINAVKTPAIFITDSGLSITPKTRYSVRFDPIPDGHPSPSATTEYADSDLIGPGFGSITSARLVTGQKVYLTYNGREIHAEVTQHREHLDEVDVTIVPNGQEVSFNS